MNGFEIAIVGMAGRFPGASCIDEFWSNLRAGKESMSFFTAEELVAAGVSAESLSQENYVKAKGIIEGAEYFDADFFNLTSREALMMDPQTRILCETVYNALEHACCNPEKSNGLIGVYMGAAPNVKWQQDSFMTCGQLFSEEFATLLLNDKDFLSTRLSYLLNLKGPSMSIYTACSTSLVVVDTACQALLTGKCDIALAGAVSLSLPVKSGYFYQPGMIMSKDGHTRSFDQQASGAVFSDGAATVVLKRYSDAVADGDVIHGIIKGVGINNDGAAKVGYTAPSVSGQAAAIRSAYEMAELELSSIGYLETHGSATFIGDRIEMEALHEVFADTPDSFLCPAGSVKSNFGHLNTAAGMAGLIKTLLVLKHGEIPPSLHCTAPIPAVNTAEAKFYINTSLIPWPHGNGPRRAGISSFGIGGTNVHLVLEAAPARAAATDNNEFKLLLLSAKTPAALERNTNRLLDAIVASESTGLNDIEFTLQMGRAHFSERKFIVANDRKRVVDLLSGNTKRGVYTAAAPEDAPPLVMVFAGIGTGYIKAGALLYSKYAGFKNEIDKCFDLLAEHGYTQDDNIFGNPDAAAVTAKPDFLRNQVNIFVFEYALGSWLISAGIIPAAFAGYSLGEYAAACLAGIFSLEDALYLLVKRGELVSTQRRGAMLSVPLTAGELLPLLPHNLYIAIDNKESCVVAGDYETVKQFEAECAAKRMFTFLISSHHAIHIPVAAEISVKFRNCLRNVVLNPPSIPMLANVSGGWMTEAQAVDPGYWVQHLTQTVLFSDNIDVLAGEFPEATFLEIGPGNDIGLLLKRCLPESKQESVLNIANNDDSTVPQQAYFLQRLGMLWLRGHQFNWECFHTSNRGCKTPLPGYSFERQLFPVQFEHTAMLPATRPAGAGVKQELSKWFYLPAWRQKSAVTANKAVIKATAVILAETGCKLAAAMDTLLREDGQTPILVYAESSYSKTTDYQYGIDATAKEDYIQLFAAIAQSGITFNQVVDLRTYGSMFTVDAVNDGIAVTRNVLDCLESVSFTIQALDAAKAGRDITITLAGSRLYNVTGNEAVCADKTPAMALLKVIPQEFPGTRCRIIDLDPANAAALSAAQLYRELLLVADGDPVAFRGRSRWIQFFEPVALPASEGCPAILRKGGNYLITGGMGNIGMAIARYLHETCDASIILCSRKGMPERNEWEQILDAGELHPHFDRVSTASALEKAGAKLYFGTADVADRDAMEKLVAETEATLGPVHGVFHAAGIIQRDALRVINGMQRSDFEVQLNAKVQGTLVLADIFNTRHPDFILMTSSLSPLLGGLGLASYAAANQFMDAWAHQQALADTRWISLNWADWSGWEKQVEGLMISDEAMNVNISAAEGIETLRRILHHHSDYPQTVISSSDLEARLNKWIRLDSMDQLLGKTSAGGNSLLKNIKKRPEIMTVYAEPATELEQHIVRIWESILGYDTIGVHDDFMELGGDSLKAITMLSRIRQVSDVPVQLEQFFMARNVRAIAAVIENSAASGIEAYTRAPLQDNYPLSSAQRRLFFLREFDVTEIGYNETHAEILEGQLDISRLELSFMKVIERHDILRGIIEMTDEGPQQRILPAAGFTITRLGKATGDELPGIIEKFIRPFDFAEPPFMRVGIVELDLYKYLLVLDRHHIISDVISSEILLREAISFYTGIELPEMKFQYIDYVMHQLAEKNSNRLEVMAAFWKERFSDGIPVISLPLNFPRPAVPGFNGGVYKHTLSEALTARLRQTALQLNVTVFNLLLSSVNVWLARITGQEDIVIGTPVAGRNHPDLENIIGIFINTLALRNMPAGNKTFELFAREVNQRTIESVQHQEYQYEDLLEELNVPKQISNNPLFDVMFVLHNQSIPELVIPGIKRSPYRFNTTKAKVDINVVCWENAADIDIEFEYSAALFHYSTIEAWVSYFDTIITTLLGEPAIELSKVSLLAPEARVALQQQWSGPAVEAHLPLVLQELFEQQAAKTPGAAAVVGFQETLTYAQLNSRANQLAHYLRTAGIGKGDIAALVTGRDISSVLTMLAVVKAGAAYLPVEPRLPDARCHYMIEDSGALLILADNSTIEKAEILAAKTGLKVVNADDPALYPDNDANPAVINTPGDAVYAIYTSGSTGKPKGILLKHLNAVNLVQHCIHHTCLNYNRVLQFSTISFDVSFSEIFYTLCSGGTLYMIEDDARKDLAALLGHIALHKISTVFLPMSLLRVIFSDPDNVKQLPGCIRHIQTAGEQVVINDHFKQYLRQHGVWLHNHYGPSETHVVTTLEIDPAGEIPALPSIGKPVINTDIYIVNQYGHLQPSGIPGELYAGGAQVGLGYIGRDDLTKAAFLPDPFTKQGVMYRTGDIACRRADGSIDFYGRKDGQVKIRGHRVEPGEIENALTAIAGIRQAVVKLITDKDGEKTICAYVVTSGDFDEQSVRRQLALNLPDYMVPSFIVTMDDFPVTNSGKIDYTALPAPVTALLASTVLPGNETEAIMRRLWSEVLDLPEETIGVTDNFFEKGGHSLKAMQLLYKVEKKFGRKILLAEFFKAPFIAQNAKMLGHSTDLAQTAFTAAAKAPYYPASAFQQQMYYLQLADPQSVFYNMPAAFIADGGIDTDAVTATMAQLISRHSLLRTFFTVEGGAIVQNIHDAVDWKPEIISPVQHDEIDDVIRAFIRPFNLALAPLVRMALAPLSGSNKSLIIVDFHHIISDGITIRFFMQEFSALYSRAQLEPCVLEYKDYAVWENEVYPAEIQPLQQQYWLKRLGGLELERSGLPCDYSRPASMTHAGGSVHTQVNDDLYTDIKQFAQKQETSVYVCLVSAFHILLSKITGDGVIITGTPVSGRHRPGLEDVWGPFLNTIPVASTPTDDITFEDFTRSMHELVMQDIAHQEFTVDKISRLLQLTPQPGRNPLFDVAIEMDYSENRLPLIPGFEIKQHEISRSMAKFDLALYCKDIDGTLHFEMNYASEIFNHTTVVRFMNYFKTILEQVMVSPGMPSGNLILQAVQPQLQ